MTFENVVDHHPVALPRGSESNGHSSRCDQPSGYHGEAAKLLSMLGGEPAHGHAASARRSWLIRKRLLDLVLGSALALVALPVIVVLAIGVAITLREWPFFVQERVGRNGKLISFPKLRTLPSIVSPYAPKYELNLELGRFATFLRLSHLDELPQLLLVPLGRLSLVGPRPKMPDEFEPVPQLYGTLRVAVPQGCTGLWQIGRHHHELPHESPEYDFFYLAHSSMRLDAWILWRTMLKLAGLGQPVGLDDVPKWVDKRRPSFAFDGPKLAEESAAS